MCLKKSDTKNKEGGGCKDGIFEWKITKIKMN